MVEKEVSKIKQQMNETKQEIETSVKVVQNRINDEGIREHTNLEKSKIESKQDDSEHENLSTSYNNSNRFDSQENDKNKVHLWIVGSSIIKDFKAKLIYRQKNVKLTTLRDKTIYSARQLLKDKSFDVDNILFQITAEDVIEDATLLISDTKKLYPDCNIIVSDVLQRFYRNREDSIYYEEKRQKYDRLLSDLREEENLKLAKHDQLQYFDFTDGIHLTDSGIRKCYQRVTNPLLGIQSSQIKDKYQFNYQQRSNPVGEKSEHTCNWNDYRKPVQNHQQFGQNWNEQRKSQEQYHHSTRPFINNRSGNNYVNNQSRYPPNLRSNHENSLYASPQSSAVNNIELIEMLLRTLKY